MESLAFLTIEIEIKFIEKKTFRNNNHEKYKHIVNNTILRQVR